MNPRGTLVDRCDHCGMTLRPMTPEQHAAVEAVYRDLAEQVEYYGAKRSPWVWHQLMMQAFFVEMGWPLPEFLPALVGDDLVPVSGSPRQSRLTKKQGSELIEFARSEAIRRGVKLSASKRELAQYGMGQPA